MVCSRPCRMPTIRIIVSSIGQASSISPFPDDVPSPRIAVIRMRELPQSAEPDAKIYQTTPRGHPVAQILKH
ncbi:unnamed protein product [Penicillium roqueforti FM164]|uniref:Genomic scaffold, ProqFM164S01 n=1 Tax=Penicillium roqueforti (strain FM164) TaxID=1365484 RepID=W6PQP0_PENRF|nr:unnamed protein product [Penicillium roqueforti FM164]